MGKNKKACVYLRASTADPNEQATSLHKQREELLKLAEREGYEIVKLCAEARSGNKTGIEEDPKPTP